MNMCTCVNIKTIVSMYECARTCTRCVSVLSGKHEYLCEGNKKKKK